jgi:hypothetical protein
MMNHESRRPTLNSEFVLPPLEIDEMIGLERWLRYSATGRRFTLIRLPIDRREATPSAQLFVTCGVFDGAAAELVLPTA